MKELIAKDLKEGMLLKSAYSFVSVVKVNVRKKTTQVFYSSSGFVPSNPWQFKNDEIVHIKS